MNDPNLNGPVRGRPVSGSPVRGRQAGNAAAGGARKAQLEMIRGNDPVPAVKKPVAGYMLRQAKLDDMHSYSQTFRTAFDEPSPFADLIRKMLPGGFLVVEHIPTGTVIAASTAAIYPRARHPDGHSLQWVVAHSSHLGTGSGQATVAAATQVLAETAPRSSYLSTDDHRLPAINIYLKLGWKPLLFQDDQTPRWSKVFGQLGIPFDEKEWPTKPW